MVDKPTPELVILQQPIANEHMVILNRICEEIGLNPSVLYITNIIKCHTENLKVWESLACSSNLLDEIRELSPVCTIICGGEPLKWYKRFVGGKFAEMPSLSVLFKGKSGINRMKETLRILKETYIDG